MAMTGEDSSGTNWSWREGAVDVEDEHIELRYGDAAKGDCKEWLPVTLIGKPANHVFPVLWLMSPDNPSREEMINAARKELDFYLVEKGEPNPTWEAFTITGVR